MNKTSATKTNFIFIKGARVHNLKNIDVSIPRNKFIVITGLSGSGKSSLAFDTLYAEGQRRYVESLSAYARQFLGRINKPEVDYIKGIPPAIAIEQKVNTRNPRSTVGTSTEVYDYLKLLFARIGKTFSPISNQLVKRHSISDVVDYILTLPVKTRVLILCKFHIHAGRTVMQQLEVLLQQGFSRIEIIDEKDIAKSRVVKISDIIKKGDGLPSVEQMALVIDRIVVNNDNDTASRIADSVQTAFFEGKGECIIHSFETGGQKNAMFSNRFEADGLQFEEPNIHMFSFNNPIGACPKCEGFGKVMGIDEEMVVPDKRLSVYEDAIACWRGDKMSAWKQRLISVADGFGFPIHKPYYELTDAQRELLWTGNEYFDGLHAFFEEVEKQSYKIQYRVMLSRYRGKTICPECKGSRLKKEAAYVKVGDKSIHQMVLMPIDRLSVFFSNLQLDDHDKKIAKRILTEINSRLQFLIDVGLGYLTLNRLSSTLSGGESQRINLATSLGSSLVGSLYILDEPSIGLHARDSYRLIDVLNQLKQLGNTVVVVEHDEDIIRAADEIIDIGPLAGIHGGEIVAQGDLKKIMKNKKSLTTSYLNGSKQIPVPKTRRKWNNYIGVVNARENNLKNISVKFPLGVLTVVTGVSGSGKSTLVNKILFAALTRNYKGSGEKAGRFDMLNGDLHLVSDVELVDQNPIGKSSRSNPVTYIKAYDEIRKLFSQQQAAVINGFNPSHFSFNIAGGRCEECQGEGTIKIEMQFMADIELTCESCNGKRFKDDVLDVKYNGKNIYDILELSVEEAILFFAEGAEYDSHIDLFSDKRIKSLPLLERKIIQKLKLLSNVGLGYVKLGQASSTLSGGESQRIKLASFLSKEQANEKKLFIFDEPTTGLHFHDVKKLLDAFQALIQRGNTIIVIEHNAEIIKSADWVIDLGKEGGEKGGNIIFEGTPDDLITCKDSYTGKYLKSKMKKQ